MIGSLFQRIASRFRPELPKVAQPVARLQIEEAPAGLLPPRPKTGRQSKAFGNTWDVLASALGGLVANPDKLTVDDYQQMATQDETVKAGLEYAALTVIANMGEYENENKRGFRYVMEMLGRCETSIPEWAMEAETARWVGYSVTEKVLKFDEGKIWCAELPVLDPHLQFVVQADRTAPNYGKVKGVRQDYTSVGLVGLGEFEEIPVEHLILHSRNSVFGNPYGVSDLKSFYYHWVGKRALALQWGRTLERYGSPSTYANAENLDAEEQSWQDTARRVTRGDNIMEMLRNLGEDAVAVFPPDIQLQILQMKSAFGTDFERYQNHANKCILRGLLIPALLFEPTDIGSFALGEKHFDIFMASSLYETERVQRSLLRWLIGPLLRWNFGPNMPIGRFKKPRLSREVISALASVFYSMTQAGYMSPNDRASSDFVRDTVGLPPYSDEELARAASAKQSQDLPAGQAPDGKAGTDPGQPHTTPQAPGGPQGRAAANGRAYASKL